jgi:hypothetical protein
VEGCDGCRQPRGDPKSSQQVFVLRAVNLKDTHLMTRDIADIDYVLLGVFGILRADIEN